MQGTSPVEMFKRKWDSRHLETKKIALLLLLASFLIGMLYGTLMLREGIGISSQLQFLVDEHTQFMREKTLFESFFSTFTSVFIFLLISYLLGFCAIGQPFLLLIPFFKGLGLGAFMGYLYISYGFLGVGYCLLIVLPYTLLALFSIIIGCRESFRLSNALFRGVLLGSGAPIEKGALKLYHIKYVVLSIFVFVSAFIHIICILLFSNLFLFIG